MTSPSVGVAVLTYNSRHHLSYCLPPILQSPIKPKILVVDSSSSDGTLELARQFGVGILQIPKEEFNHGTTRERARKELGTDIVVMMTPDAYATHPGVLETLVCPLLEKKAALAYARQIPRTGAKIFEAFPRYFNYPKESQLRSIEDLERLGAYTFFFSDSFGAYQNALLDEIGGFSPVLTGEDTVACAKLLLRGHRVAYVAEAEVRHSHNYSILQEFKRHFDTGLARATYQEFLQLKVSDSARGREYVKSLMAYLLRESPSKIPYALVQTAFKWLGYQIGKRSIHAPLWMKKRLSSQGFYWNNLKE